MTRWRTIRNHVLGLWLPRRWRFARLAAQAQRLRDSGAGMEVFAFRALARQPIAVLASLESDPAVGWRHRDPKTIQALASLELRTPGLESGRSS